MTACSFRPSTTPSVIAWRGVYLTRRKQRSPRRPGSCWRCCPNRQPPRRRQASSRSASWRMGSTTARTGSRSACWDNSLALPIELEISTARLLTSELVAHVKTEGYSVVCLADLPPSPPSRTRLLVKKLREAMPDLRIVVGRWASPDLADDTFQPLTDAGASHVASSLLDTRKYLAAAALVAAPTAQVAAAAEAMNVG